MSQSVLFRNKNFFCLWISHFVTKMGDSMVTIATLWTVYSISNSAFGVGLISISQIAPIIIFTFYSGILADSYDNKKIMVFSDLSRAMLLFILFIFWFFADELTKILLLFITMFLLSSLSSFFDTSYQSTIKRTVIEKDLVEANSWLQFARHFANIFGLLLGGILVEGIGIVNVFLVNSICYFFSGLLILYAKIPHHEQSLDSKKILHNVKTSFNYLKNASPLLKQSLWYIIIINISVAPLTVIFTLLSDRTDLGSLALSVINCVFAIGSILGAYIAPKIIFYFTKPSIIFWFISIYCISTLLAVVTGKSLFLCSVFFLCTGISSSLILIFVNAFSQKETDQEFMGRISSFRSIALRLPPPLVVLLFSSLVPALGLFYSTMMVQIITIVLSLGVTLLYKDGIKSYSKGFDQHE